MNEAQFCTVIKNSMIDGFKIPDPTGQFSATIKRAYDGIGLLEKEDGLHFCCWEAKWLKDMCAFPFKRVEPHQDYFIRAHKKAKEVLGYVIVGVDAARNDKRVLIFDWDEDFGKLYQAGFSIHKKYLEQLPYNKMSKGIFEFKEIITIDTLLKLYGKSSVDELIS